MKFLLPALFAAALLTVPTAAAPISDVDHPDIPNCAIFPKGGVNPPNCETLSIMAAHAHNGQGDRSCHTNPVTHKPECSYSW